MDKNQTIDFLKKKNFIASKKLGQNFLVNNTIKEKIVNSAYASVHDLIIEIGPGLGAITEIILKKDLNLFAIELDKRLFSELKEKFSNKPNFNIINADILKVDLEEKINNIYFNKYNQRIVIANLPYSISTQIISFIVINKIASKSIVMVQKEMAQRIVAKVGTKKYNAFSAWINLMTKVEFLFDVSPSNFIPEPNVMSSVIKLEFNNKYSKNELKTFKTFFFECFKNRRKTLLNNLLNIYSKDTILDSFRVLGFPSTIRAQELSGEELIKLLTILEKSR